MKFIAFILSFFIVTSTHADKVGRVKLILPQGEWVTLSTTDAYIKYGGDISGALKAETTTRVLLDKDKNVLAIIFVRASDGALANVAMSWNEGCKKRNTEYLVDETSGSFSRLDCLRVWRSMNPEQWIKQNTKNTSQEINKLGIKLGSQGYLIEHKVGTANGTFIATNAIISFDVLRNIPDAAIGAKYAGMPGVAWGHQLAEVDRISTRTVMGELVVPQIDYR